MYVFHNLDIILYTSGKLITRNTGNYLVKASRSTVLRNRDSLNCRPTADYADEAASEDNENIFSLKGRGQ